MTDSTSEVLELFPKGTVLSPDGTPVSIREGGDDFEKFVDTLNPLQKRGGTMGFNIYAVGDKDVPSALFPANAESVIRFRTYIRRNFTSNTNPTLEAH
ncbi:MAG: hypothetical protein AAF569_00660 [Pseudomonadota bacterium]